MNRRTLLSSLAGLIAALPLAGKAQAAPDDDLTVIYHEHFGGARASSAVDAVHGNMRFVQYPVENGRIAEEIAAPTPMILAYSMLGRDVRDNTSYPILPQWLHEWAPCARFAPEVKHVRVYWV
jgi:hypothetical protein